MSNGGAWRSSTMINTWTVQNKVLEHKTTYTAQQNWGGWYCACNVCVGRPWLISKERTKLCCIMLDNADRSVFWPTVCTCNNNAMFRLSVSLRPIMFHDWQSTRMRTIWNPRTTLSNRSFVFLLFAQSFFPDRDGRLNKFGTHVRHMEMQISFFTSPH